MEPRSVGGLTFFANFDSGNLADVQLDEEPDATTSSGGTATPVRDLAFKLWTSPDCCGTEFENGNRTWFFFGVRLADDEPEPPGDDHPRSSLFHQGGALTVKLTFMNLNKQSKLFSQGMSPLLLKAPRRGCGGDDSPPSMPWIGGHSSKWERVRDLVAPPLTYYVNAEDNNNFVLSFRVRLEPQAVTYIAFTYPYTYKELQAHLARLERKYGSHEKTFEELSSSSSSSGVYFVRENVCYSLERRRVDLVTVSGVNGLSGEREVRLRNLFPAAAAVEKGVRNKANVRPFRFPNKKVVFLSSR